MWGMKAGRLYEGCSESKEKTMGCREMNAVSVTLSCTPTPSAPSVCVPSSRSDVENVVRGR